MVIHSHGMVFETRFQYQSFMVDLNARHCTCRLWDLSGIPCVHAIAAINYIHKTPEGYVHPYFSKDTFISCYEKNIKPVNGSNMWEETPVTPRPSDINFTDLFIINFSLNRYYTVYSYLSVLSVISF